ncbi:AraD1 family protein [Massilia sp. PWRC2]|uniref:AraD1 family protein n=1 Tax=Massilia sp. PWRC2 TaxID=2804626 RepID=UPI003CF0323A
MLLVQFIDEQGQRRVGVFDGAAHSLWVLATYPTTYALAQAAIAAGRSLAELATSALDGSSVDYAGVAAAGRLLAPLDHVDPAHCFVTGTGLTHLGSADTRDAMHQKIGGAVEALSDSMKMFRLGVEGGKPASGIGVQPEWFYKGDGSIVRAGEQPLTMPAFSRDGGEEPEIAGLYLIGAEGQPYRLGFALANEFSDHATERQNYLYLAHSKLRQCAVGPALLVGDLPAHVAGSSRVRGADGVVRWEKPFVSGEDNMSHTVANLEHHHFKYDLFRRPGDVHVHFFGTATLSFADGIVVAPGERFEIDVAAFGPPLRNPLAIDDSAAVAVRAL